MLQRKHLRNAEVIYMQSARELGTISKNILKERDYLANKVHIWAINSGTLNSLLFYTYGSQSGDIIILS